MTYRSTAFENLVKEFIKVSKSSEEPGVKLAYIKNLCAKGEILVSRENDEAVIREMVNGKH